MSPSSTLQQRFYAWLSDNPEPQILRWVFRGLVALTMAVLAYDLATTNGWIGDYGPAPPAPGATRTASPETDLPDDPSLLAPMSPDADKRVVPVPPPQGAMAKPMTFELIAGGRLMANGTITPGTSGVFAAEIGKRGDYVRTVVLDSPGGSVNDALVMGRLIRARKFATEVEAGSHCVSSCPLVFAAGMERRVGDKAVIGVHQVAAMASAGAPRDEMELAQRISARCQRYLGDMGVSPEVWLHAMETPHDKLFVFKPDELKSLNIVTPAAMAAPKP
jgi:hypothetical protein